MFVAAVQFGVDFSCIGHELTGMLHVCVREHSVMRGFFVVAVHIVFGSKFMVFRRRSVMHRGVGVAVNRFVRDHTELLNES